MTTATATRDRLIQALAAIEDAHDLLESAMESLERDLYDNETVSEALYNRLDDKGWNARHSMCDLTAALRIAVASSR